MLAFDYTVHLGDIGTLLVGLFVVGKGMLQIRDAVRDLTAMLGMLKEKHTDLAGTVKVHDGLLTAHSEALIRLGWRRGDQALQ